MIIRPLGRVDFQQTWEKMRAFTDARTPETEDELWVCEHAPVFTQGVAGKPEHLLFNPSNIPVIKTDRGGQHYAVTRKFGQHCKSQDRYDLHDAEQP